MSVPRFSFGPSTADKLLSRSSSLHLRLSRWPGEDAQAECEFEVRGSVPLAGDEAAELLQDLVAEFRRPLTRDGQAEEGAQ